MQRAGAGINLSSGRNRVGLAFAVENLADQLLPRAVPVRAGARPQLHDRPERRSVLSHVAARRSLRSDRHDDPRRVFSAEIYPPLSRASRAPAPWWWALGIAVYGVGTFTEAATTLIGWNEPTFRAWYISGALLGGAPLAQGTVYLLLSRRTAHALTALLVSFVAIASVAVILSPIDYSQVEAHRLTGRVLGVAVGEGLQPVREHVRRRLPDRRRDPLGAALQRQSRRRGIA